MLSYLYLLVQRIISLFQVWIRTTSPNETSSYFLILGGSRYREIECAKLISKMLTNTTHSIIILSSGCSSSDEISHLFQKTENCYVYIDHRAVDTLSNFTTLAYDLQKSGCRSLVVATSEAHISRAYPIGQIILGSFGISISKCACFNKYDKSAKDETLRRQVRDICRALIWLIFQWDGRDIATFFHPDRRPIETETSFSYHTERDRGRLRSF
mmetsp:Transcript_32190/g.41385  ORF Transcript_32190/g.41385 Transcript_32190/m.41385 type:complete len:213 (+) Transcript_32190:102-740(+)